MDERQRILKLVEDGKISADEAVKLLEAFSKQQSTSDEEQASRGSSSEQKQKGFEDLFSKAFNNRKVDEFMRDLRDDLSEFSDKMSTLFNTTLSKVKEADVEFPFGEKIEFDQVYSFAVDQVQSVEVDIPNGKLYVKEATDDFVKVSAHVKTPRKLNEDDTAGRFLEHFVVLKDGKLDISTQSKFAQVDVRIELPKKAYDVVVTRLFNGSIEMQSFESTLVKAKTYNGSVKAESITFAYADLKTVNGSIEARFIQGDDLEAETANGRIYIDGDVQEVEAESVSGNVAVTTVASKARKVKAKTVAGSVELYVPKTISIDGQAMTSFGKIDVGLADVTTRINDEQLMMKTVHFNKLVEEAALVKVIGESKTGTVIVRYTTFAE